MELIQAFTTHHKAFYLRFTFELHQSSQNLLSYSSLLTLSQSGPNLKDFVTYIPFENW